MATRHVQDKATTERHARALRELVKRPDNKFCADCKKNDARWASWNIGCFMCIRCSGIHRSLGTHISKVKSVDLDTWTPEQLASVTKWGNARANIYWEAHLKPGHIPPDHKIESFIRSKYESRRWAMEGPPPADPSVLDGAENQAPTEPEIAVSSRNTTQPSVAQAAPPVHSNVTPSLSHGQQQARQLLSSRVNNRSTSAPAQPTSDVPTASPAAAQNDLFSLDFHAPALASSTTNFSAANTSSSKNVKQDILSLFSTPSAPAAQTANFGQFGSVQPQPASSVWDSFDATTAQPPAPQSMVGASGTGMWGVSSGWNQAGTVGNPAPAQNNLWGAPAAAAPNQPSLFDTSDVWSASQPAAAAAPAKKNDAFGDLWGGFK